MHGAQIIRLSLNLIWKQTGRAVKLYDNQRGALYWFFHPRPGTQSRVVWVSRHLIIPFLWCSMAATFFCLLDCADKLSSYQYQLQYHIRADNGKCKAAPVFDECSSLYRFLIWFLVHQRPLVSFSCCHFMFSFESAAFITPAIHPSVSHHLLRVHYK